MIKYIRLIGDEIVYLECKLYGKDLEDLIESLRKLLISSSNYCYDYDYTVFILSSICSYFKDYGWYENDKYLIYKYDKVVVLGAVY